MIYRIRRGWSLPYAAAVAMFVAIAIVSPVAVAEPDGHFRLRVDPVEGRSRDGALVLRVKLQPFGPIDAATLTVAAPEGLEPRPLTPSTHSMFLPATTPEGHPAIRAVLQSVDPALETTVDLEWTLAAGRHGTIEFIVEGVDTRGRTIRDAVGYRIPDSASAGRRRLGAVEFPAVVLPSESKR